MNDDIYYLNQCIALAKKGLGTVSPNPLVGCVVLDKDDNVVGEGWHQKAGEPHAEPIALKKAGEKAKGGTLYVNLEPCNHTGKTPPCTEAIINSGIKRVVFGLQDPNPKVDGAGVKRLQEVGIEVISGVLEKECRELNKVFCHYIQHKTPFVTLKMAMTLNGQIATRNGQSQWITGTSARRIVHEIRSTHDAILTTAETVIKDNPTLNVRDVEPRGEQPIRVILDRCFRLEPNKYQIFDVTNSGQQAQQTWLFTSVLEHNKVNAQKVEEKGIKVFTVPEKSERLCLQSVLKVLGEHEVTSLMMEAGGELAGSLVAENLVNEYVLFYGAKILPDSEAKEGFSGQVCHTLSELPELEIISSVVIDGDLMVTAKPIK